MLLTTMSPASTLLGTGARTHRASGTTSAARTRATACHGVHHGRGAGFVGARASRVHRWAAARDDIDTLRRGLMWDPLLGLDGLHVVKTVSGILVEV